MDELIEKCKLDKNPYDCSVCDSEDCSGCGEYAYERGYEDGIAKAIPIIQKAERERIINKLYDYFGTNQMGMPHGRTTLARSKAKELIIGLILEDTDKALKGETDGKPTD